MIENQESVRAYVADLIEVSGMTSSSVAGKAGVFRGNLQKWLRGQGQSLGPPGVSKVLSVLGVESGHLSSAVVHFFDVKDPAPLLRVLSREHGPFRMVAVAPEKSSPRDFLTWGVTVPLFLFSDKVRIVIWQSSGFSSPLIAPLIDSGGVDWLDVPPDPYFSNPTIRTSRETFEKIRKRDLSVADYDAILFPGKKDPTWAEVVSTCEERGLTPGDVLRLIQKKEKK